MKRTPFVILIIFSILLIDQAVKFWVKTNMHYGDFIPLFNTNWAYIHFVENKGMAFGWELGGSYGKLALSLFRILAVSVMIYFLHRLIKEKAAKGILFGFSLILAGAIGNILDSAFYGLIFSESYTSGIAAFLPESGGYAGFLHGRVVDMLYFPIFDGILPEWVPFWGGERFTFFRPVFNIADSAITIGVLYILLFQRKFFLQPKPDKTEKAAEAAHSNEKLVSSNTEEQISDSTAPSS